MSDLDLAAREAALLRLFQAAEEERRQIGRTLHDGAQQRLVAIGHFLDVARKKLDADPAQAASIMERAAEEAREAGSELRVLSRELNPAALAERGLEPALTALAGSAAIPVRLDAAPAERFPDAIESAVYRLVADAIASADSEVRVAVERHGSSLVVAISHDRAAVPEGPDDRIVALGGTVEGGGTRLVASIPIPNDFNS